MSNNKWLVEKNVLDLEHNETISKAVTSMSIGMGSLPAMLFGIYIKDPRILIAMAIAAIFALVFISASFSNFTKCRQIRDKIKGINVS